MGTRTPGDKFSSFPLWQHPGGQWTKKIRGKNFYFGKDRDEALKEYVRVREDLEAGRTPRPKSDGVTVATLCNEFLTAKRARVDSGELSARMWSDYHRACEVIVEAFGRMRVVDDLRSTDFASLRAKAAKRLGPFALSKFVQLVRTVFIFAYESELIDRPIRYGDSFDKPPARVLRLERSKQDAKLIDPETARKLIDAAPPQMRAMILLGLNCGYGQSDCSGLTRDSLKRKPGWLEAPRQKTGIARRCPLWPETVEALEAVHAVRPKPADPLDGSLVFLTFKGLPWVKFVDHGTEKRGSRNDSAGQEFRKLVKNASVTVQGGMYVLRHTFRTVADEVRDTVAIDTIMGHRDVSMASAYRERIDDSRLLAVTDHVRQWLFGATTEKNSPADTSQVDE